MKARQHEPWCRNVGRVGGVGESRCEGGVRESGERAQMIMLESQGGPSALAARWREDAQVLRRYGAGGRARMLERMAAELEESIMGGGDEVVDLSRAVVLSGFTRGHLRRLMHDGKLIPAGRNGREPLFRISDLPRKPGHTALASRPKTPLEVACEVVGPPMSGRRRRGEGHG